ncbi:MAG: hypothetical protein M3Z41_10215 [Candidatus Eremiobacteraeota bacterium]|nr:hypothetical protein [Candidatus Eremiobacteraeota bacterium]
MATIDALGASADLVRSLNPAATGFFFAAFLIYIVAPFAAGLTPFMAAPTLDELGKYFSERLPDDAVTVDVAFGQGSEKRARLVH